MCSTCPKPATLACGDCAHMNYCSKACYKKDAESHAPLCAAYPNFHEQHRPSSKHFRCIWLPVDAMQPRFVWLKHIGLDNSLTPDRDELERYVPGTPNGGDAAFDCFREGNRYLSQEIVVYHDLKAKGKNAYMKALLGKDPGHFSWRGALLAVGSKSRILELWSADEPRRVERRKKEVTPVDFDIMSLPPVLSFLSWRARSIDNYLLAEEAEAVWPKKHTPQKKGKSAKVEEEPGLYDELDEPGLDYDLDDGDDDDDDSQRTLSVSPSAH